MPDLPGSKWCQPNTILTTLDPLHGVWPYGAPIAGGTWPAANRAIYIPVLVELPVTVYQIIVLPTVQSGNLDVGIYAEDGTRLVSQGSTAVGTAAAFQAVNITDTVLNPGVVFLAMNVDNTTAAFQRGASGTNTYLRMYGVQQQAVGAVTLPATATFANPSSGYVPFISALCMSSTA